MKIIENMCLFLNAEEGGGVKRGTYLMGFNQVEIVHIGSENGGGG